MISRSLDFDVIVVGAGLAGLAAAYALRDLRVGILEREPRLGGRVHSVSAWGSWLDLGACFAYDPRLLPASHVEPSVRYEERGPIGLYTDGRLVLGASPQNVVEQLSLSDTSRVARAFFQQIHPGDMAEYTTERQADAWADWYPDHWETGNGSLVDAYSRELTHATCLRANVRQLREDADGVEVTYEVDGQRRKAQARAVVVATPATVARNLVTPREPACAEFLRSVRYARYTVVGFAFPEQPLAERELRCIVTPDEELALVIQQVDTQRRVRSLLCYYDGVGSRFADNFDDAALVQVTARTLARLGVIEQLVGEHETWVKRWDVAGTVLSAKYAALKRAEYVQANARIFLAGDYMSTTPGWGYGMDDAVASGRVAGERVMANLQSER